MKFIHFYAVLLGLTCAAQAHTHVYEAVLSGLNEDIPNASIALGTSTVTLDLDLITMQVEIDFADLSGGSTSAFIYGPTIVPATGTAGPMTPSLADSGFPIGVTGGTYSHLFDITDAPGYNAAFITGTISDALNTLIFSFEDGTAYLSIRSSAFPGGEIRGFFSEIEEVPEPGSITMVFAGSCGLALLRRRA